MNKMRSLSRSCDNTEDRHLFSNITPEMPQSREMKYENTNERPVHYESSSAFLSPYTSVSSKLSYSSSYKAPPTLSPSQTHTSLDSHMNVTKSNDDETGNKSESRKEFNDINKTSFCDKRSIEQITTNYSIEDRSNDTDNISNTNKIEEDQLNKLEKIKHSQKNGLFQAVNKSTSSGPFHASFNNLSKRKDDLNHRAFYTSKNNRNENSEMKEIYSTDLALSYMRQKFQEGHHEMMRNIEHNKLAFIDSYNSGSGNSRNSKTPENKELLSEYKDMPSAVPNDDQALSYNYFNSSHIYPTFGNKYISHNQSYYTPPPTTFTTPIYETTQSKTAPSIPQAPSNQTVANASLLSATTSPLERIEDTGKNVDTTPIYDSSLKSLAHHKHSLPNLKKHHSIDLHQASPHNLPYNTTPPPHNLPYNTTPPPHNLSYNTTPPPHNLPYNTTPPPHNLSHKTISSPQNLPHNTTPPPHNLPHNTTSLPHNLPHNTISFPHTIITNYRLQDSNTHSTNPCNSVPSSNLLFQNLSDKKCHDTKSKSDQFGLPKNFPNNEKIELKETNMASDSQNEMNHAETEACSKEVNTNFNLTFAKNSLNNKNNKEKYDNNNNDNNNNNNNNNNNPNSLTMKSERKQNCLKEPIINKNIPHEDGEGGDDDDSTQAVYMPHYANNNNNQNNNNKHHFDKVNNNNEKESATDNHTKSTLDSTVENAKDIQKFGDSKGTSIIEY